MNFCTNCGTRLVAGLRFCTSCGAPLSATPAEPPRVDRSPLDPPPVAVDPPPVAVDPPPVATAPSATAPSHRAATTDEQVLPWLAADRPLWTTDDADPRVAGHGSHRGVPVAAVVVVTAVVLAGLVAFTLHALSADSPDPATAATPADTGKKSGGASTPTDAPSEPASAKTAAAAVVGTAAPGLPAGQKDVAGGADITAPPSSKGRVDSKGRPAKYPPKAMLDTDPSTAWRMDGDGSGQTITVSFGRRVTMTGLALDPGFDKTGKNEDRWKENRRISAATFTTDDGSAFTVSFATAVDLPVKDRLQFFMLPAPVETRTVRVHIDTTEPSPPRTFDTTAISRLAVLGS